MRWFLPLPLLLILVSCGDRQPPPGSTRDDPDAAAIALRLDQRQQTIARMEAAERSQAEAALGPELEEAVAVCAGTRHENKAVYWLAQWSLVHRRAQGPQPILALLDRLDRLPSPAFQQPGKALRVRVLLWANRASEARPIAAQLERDLPQLGAQAWIDLYDLVGRAAPPLGGVVAGGSSAVGDALTAYVFIAAIDPDAERWLRPWLDLARGAAGRVRLVVVVGSGSLLDTGLAAARLAAGGTPVEVRWAATGDTAWTTAWSLPQVPLAVLAGPAPQGTVLAVDAVADDLARALR